MIDKKYIGHKEPPFEVLVETGRLKFFAKAIGETNPLYLDAVAARAAGHRDILVPATFLFCLESEAPNPAAIRNLLGMDYRRLLHAEQGFTYYAQAYAGDVLRFEQQVEDIYDKKNGAMEFVVKKTRVSDVKGSLIADLRSVSIIRNQV